MAKDTFHYIDSQIFAALARWIKKRHPNKSATWMQKTYFRKLGNRNWIFYAKLKSQQADKNHLHLFTVAKVPIRRHIKIKAEATPYDAQYKDYFIQREQRKKVILKTERRWSASFPDIAMMDQTHFIAGSTEAGFRKA